MQKKQEEAEEEHKSWPFDAVKAAGITATKEERMLDYDIDVDEAKRKVVSHQQARQKYPVVRASADSTAAHQQHENDDEEFEVDEEHQKLRLPMHIVGDLRRTLAQPENGHFVPMSHYVDHPFFAAKHANQAGFFLHYYDHYLQ